MARYKDETVPLLETDLAEDVLTIIQDKIPPGETILVPPALWEQPALALIYPNWELYKRWPRIFVLTNKRCHVMALHSEKVGRWRKANELHRIGTHLKFEYSEFENVRARAALRKSLVTKETADYAKKFSIYATEAVVLLSIWYTDGSTFQAETRWAAGYATVESLEEQILRNRSATQLQDGEPTPDPIPLHVTCPGCGASTAEAAGRCPYCNLPIETAVQAGWFKDPAGSDLLRWFDGSQWSERTRDQQ